MINMRNGTDEGGWRYNAWFKNKGWSDHAGGLGWGGWVRRREMIRLRGMRKVAKSDANIENSVGKVDGDVEKTRPEQALGGLLSSDEIDENVENVMRSLGRVPLDRRKLETWQTWLNEGDQGSLQKLQQVLHDEGSVSHRRSPVAMLI
jgi:hypothetical protein